MSMEPLPGSGRGTRLTLVALALLLLLALVAFASRSGFTHHGPQAAPSQAYTSYAMTVFLILFVLMIPVAVYAYSIRLREKAKSGSQKSFQARVLGYGLRLFVIFGIGFLLFRFRRTHQLFQHLHPFGLGVANRKTGHGHAHTQYNPTFQWSVLWITLALLAVAGAYTYYKWRTRIPPFVPREASSVADDFAVSIGSAIDDLESEPDARRAVIAAYARMEAVLGRNGLHRAVSETALEYLRRVLLGLTTRGEPVQRLTGLFEQAKFSNHRIDESMKQDAIGALREIRADLQAAPA